MKINRVRKVGNSKVLSLPRELERVGFVDGAQVVIQELPSGEVILIPADRLTGIVREHGRRIVAKNKKALDSLADHDRRR